jgi:flagellar hook-associated protein 2
MTGMYSGLDTESLVTQLTDAYQTKVDNAQKKVTKAQWKKEAWASLNTKLMNFYKGALSTFKSTTTYNTKAVKGDLSGISITASSSAVNGNHKVKVNSTATAQMWTGYKINDNKVSATSYTAANDATASVDDLTTSDGHNLRTLLEGSEFTVSDGNSTANVKVTVGADASVEDVLKNINDQITDQGITGVTASFENGALKFTNDSASALKNDATGETVYSGGYDVTVTATDSTSATALGLSTTGTTIKALSADNETNSASGTAFAYEKVTTPDSSVTGTTRLIDLGIAAGSSIKVNGTEIAIDNTTTLNSLAKAMTNAGINASYDENQGRLYLSAKNTGIDNAFTVEADDATMEALGLNFASDYEGKIDAADASITYNGVTYVQATNTFNINGLTMNATNVGEEQSFTVDTDVDGIYDKVKSFVTEYNTLISEMNTLYDADSATDYEPLTSDEKEAMNDEDIENWENKIKSSLLRRDSTISSLLTNMRTIMNKSVEVTNSDGTTSKYALSSFGIVTSTYTENGQLHIYGNSDDSDFMDYDDKLKAAIAANPDAVTKTLTSLGSEMYEYMRKAMAKSDSSSSLTFYDDITMDSEIEDYKDDVSDLQDKLEAEEDKFYSQFSTMETALSKLQAQQTYISQLLGS